MIINSVNDRDNEIILIIIVNNDDLRYIRRRYMNGTYAIRTIHVSSTYAWHIRRMAHMMAGCCIILTKLR